MRFQTLSAFLCFGIVSLFSQNDSEKADSLNSYEAPTISVTSTRATQQKSPVAFSEIEKEELELRYTARDLPQLMQYEPSIISWSENGNYVGYTNMSLRGFDQRRLAVLVNGIPQNDPEDHNVYWINFSDIGSSLHDIQIQRGAGLINYGAAAIAGSINLTTSIEANQPGIRYSTGIGLQEFGAEDEIRQNITKNLFEYSSGITEIGGTPYAFYGKLARINSDGYRDQSWAQLTSWFLSGVRFDENLTTQINVWGGSQRDGLAYIGLPKSSVGDLSLRRENYNGWGYDSTGRNLAWAANTRPQEIEDFSSPHFEILNDWKIDEGLNLKSSLFYYTGTGYFDFDGSWANASTFALDNQYNIDGVTASNSIIRAWVGNRQGGWIPRLVWDHGNGTLTTGVEMRWHSSEHWGKINYAENLPEGYDPDFKFYEFTGDRTVLSAFARESYQLNDMITLQAGGQLVYNYYGRGEEKLGGEFREYETVDGRIRAENNLFNIDYIFFNPRLGALFNIDENQSAYASAALTTREPRMNNLYDASGSYYGTAPQFVQDLQGRYDFTQPLVKPEQMLDIELGYRYVDTWINIGVGGYWMEFTDELVKNGQQNIFGSPVDGNAPKTRHIGLEMDLRAEIWSNDAMALSFGGNGTISHNELIEHTVYLERYDENLNQIVKDSFDLSGNEITGFPPFIANAFLQYNWSDFVIRTNLRSVGSFRTDNFGDMINDPELDLVKFIGYSDNTVDAYKVLSIDAAYTLQDVFGTQSLTIRAQVDNLTNELYAASGLGRNFFPSAERSYWFGMEVGL